MTGEVSLDGIYIPTLLLIAMAASPLTFGVMRIVSAFGLYRFVAYRALVDLCLFILVFGLLVWLLPLFGIVP
ncbi:MAG: DUF1656 domain-containing protein [Pseudomonadota bacterium]